MFTITSSNQSNIPLTARSLFPLPHDTELEGRHLGRLQFAAEEVRHECAAIALDALRVFHKLLDKVDRVPEIARRAAVHIFNLLGCPVSNVRHNPYATPAFPAHSAADSAAPKKLFEYPPTFPITPPAEPPAPAYPTVSPAQIAASLSIFSFITPGAPEVPEATPTRAPTPAADPGAINSDAVDPNDIESDPIDSDAINSNSTDSDSDEPAAPSHHHDLTTMRPPTYSDSDEYLNIYLDQLEPRDFSERIRVASILDRKELARRKALDIALPDSLSAPRHKK